MMSRPGGRIWTRNFRSCLPLMSSVRSGRPCAAWCRLRRSALCACAAPSWTPCRNPRRMRVGLSYASCSFPPPPRSSDSTFTTCPNAERSRRREIHAPTLFARRLSPAPSPAAAFWVFGYLCTARSWGQQHLAASTPTDCLEGVGVCGEEARALGRTGSVGTRAVEPSHLIVWRNLTVPNQWGVRACMRAQRVPALRGSR